MFSDTFYSRFFHLFLLTLAIAISYSGTLEHSWHFDDICNIVKNESIKVENLGWEEINKALYSPYTGTLSRSFAFFTFALNYYFSGFDTTGYHLVNIAIHILCAIFSYLVFVRTLEIYQGSSRFSSSFSVSDIALLGAMLWALHPIQTQAVTYIVQRMASMSALLYMMAMYCYLCFRTGSGRHRWMLLALAGLFWVAGIFTKENAILLPLSLLAYEFSFFGLSLRWRKSVALLLAGFFAIVGTLVFFLMFSDIQQFSGFNYEIRPYSMWQRLLTQPIILCRYLFLILLPIADFLSIESDIFASTGILSPPITLPANLFITALVIVSILYVRRYPLLCFAALFYFINHLVESTVINLELYFEHRNYLPSIFIYFAISYYFCKIVDYYFNQKKVFLHSLFVFAMTFILVSEGNATLLRNDVWKTEVSLLTDAIEKSPGNMRPYISLGVEYMKINQRDKAKESYRKAEKIYKLNPDKHQRNFVALLYYNAGMLSMKDKENAKAIQLLLKSADLDPASWETHVNLGYLFFTTGDMERAETAFNNGLSLRPDQADIYYMLGKTLYVQGKFEVAEKIFNAGLEVKETNGLQLNLVATYLRLGEIRSARSILLRMPRQEEEWLYLLYRALLFDEEKDRRLGEIAALVLAENRGYCEWVTEVMKNNHAGLIYPDQFKDLEHDIRQAYLDKLTLAIEKIEEREKFTKECNLTGEKIVGTK